MSGAIVPIPVAEHRPPAGFQRGGGAVRWFAVSWLAKNLAHLLASAVASEDIDARDWMRPAPPEALLEKVAQVLGAEGSGDTLCERLGRDLWIDYVADTGDDPAVCRAVASMVAREYELTLPGDGESIEAPRGDVLLFGGDTAYPVATREEIARRLLVPWNGILAERGDGPERALLGIPGNHDWNDGLDGFGRLFRRRDSTDVPGDPSHPALALRGYIPVQEASYFALPLSAGVDLLGVDRQLAHVDYRQRQYFHRARAERPERGLLVAQADPHRSYCRDNPDARAAAAALGLDRDDHPHLFVAGDTHHYQRWTEDGDTHVVAGGGGASLHGAPRSEDREGPALDGEWPKHDQCEPLVRGTFVRVARGAAGLFIHLVMGVVTLVGAGIGAWLYDRAGMMVSGGVLFFAALIVAQVAWGKRSRFHALVAGLLVGIPLAAVVVAAARFVPAPWPRFDDSIAVLVAALGASVAGGVGAAAAIAYLAWRGVDYNLAYAGLAHPGFKHFLRMRVRADGSGIDVWCLGKHDPCGDPDDRVLLVDAFPWSSRPPE